MLDLLALASLEPNTTVLEARGGNMTKIGRVFFGFCPDMRLFRSLFPNLKQTNA